MLRRKNKRVYIFNRCYFCSFAEVLFQVTIRSVYTVFSKRLANLRCFIRILKFYYHRRISGFRPSGEYFVYSSTNRNPNFKVKLFQAPLNRLKCLQIIKLLSQL